MTNARGNYEQNNLKKIFRVIFQFLIMNKNLFIEKEYRNSQQNEATF